VSAAPALDYMYRYAFSSMLEDAKAGPRLRLATSGGAEPNPFFFQGELRRPDRAADLLRGLSEIVDARFNVPPSMLAKILRLADPVVTSGEGTLRFEVFSQCCGAYARVDLLPESFKGEQMGRGTTNVDFNPPLRAALARIRAGDKVGLNVGVDVLELKRGKEKIEERKVALPVRWLKGFVEALASQARMTPQLETSGDEASRFFRSLPRTKVKEGFVSPMGRGLRLSQASGRDSVRVAGVERLRVLEGLARHCVRARVHVDANTGASAWELDMGDSRFTLALSPEPWRGFSGEGQALEALASEKWRKLLPLVQAALTWDAPIDASALAARLRSSETDVNAALAALGTRGLVGFDLAQGAYFQRVLPFDLSRIEEQQPRLVAARKLLSAGGIKVTRREGEDVEAIVPGSGGEHRVRLGPAGARCTCPWYAKHRSDRGPCKHQLALQLFLEAERAPDDLPRPSPRRRDHVQG